MVRLPSHVRQPADGLITVDLPPEEVDAIDTALQSVGLDNIFLISPTTPDSRAQTIVERARGVYHCVAVKGVTGSGTLTRPLSLRVSGIQQDTTDSSGVWHQGR